MTDSSNSSDRSMSRRDAVGRAAALLAGAAGASALAPRAADAVPASLGTQPAARELYELRQYHMANGPRVAALGDYFRDALVPALRRAGTGPVGVFTVAVGPDSPSYYVLVPHPSLESLATLPARLAADAEYRRAGAAVLDAPSDAPAFERLESQLLLAFAGMPRMEVPPTSRRLFELRRYESRSEAQSAAKIALFDRQEIGIFRRAGMHPVFFGQSLVGPSQPNLTYLLAFDDMAAHDAQWSAFGSDPEWKAIIARPENGDARIVSSISNVFLRPTAFSQI